LLKLQKDAHDKAPMTISQPSFSSPDAAPSSASAASAKQSKTASIFRSIGYALLCLSTVDLLYVLLPPEFTNPVWEYQTIGDLVKLIPVPLLAFMLVFYGETTARSKVERHVLRVLSWSMLGIGLIFLLLIPLTVGDSIRISQYNNAQISTQVNQQKQQLDATRQQLEKATPQQLQSLVPVPDNKGQLPDAPSTPAQAKAQVLEGLDRAKEQAETQATQARNNLRKNLLKNTVKLTLESLIGGFAFMYIWSTTRWARRLQSYAMEPAAPTRPVSGKKLLQSFIPKFPKRLRRR
jgi:F0F1-type ATP synthase membrane subunit b/b'